MDFDDWRPSVRCIAMAGTALGIFEMSESWYVGEEYPLEEQDDYIAYGLPAIAIETGTATTRSRRGPKDESAGIAQTLSENQHG